MQVKLQFEAQLRELAGTAELMLDMPEQSDVLSVLQAAVSQHEQLKDRLFSGHELSRSVLIFVNDQPVSGGTAGEHQLSPADVVLLLPPISGG